MTNNVFNGLKISPFFQSPKFAFLLIAHISSGAAFVFINIFLANKLNQTEFGLFVWIYAASMICSQIAVFGSGTYYLNKYGKNSFDANLSVHSGPSFIILNFLFIFILSGLSGIYFGIDSSQLAYLACCFISFVAVQISMEMHVLRCQLKNLYKLQSIIFVAPNVLRLSGLTALFYFFESLTFNFVILFLLAINFFILVAFTGKWMSLIKSFVLSISIGKYIKHFHNVSTRGIAEASFMIYTQIPVIVVAYVFSIEQSGIFAISLTFATIFLMPSAVFTKAFSPLLFQEANKTKKLHYKIVLNFLYALASLGCLMSLGLYFTAEFLVTFFLNDSFNTSTAIIQTLCLYIFGRYLNTAISYSMYTHAFSSMHAIILITSIFAQLVFFFLAAQFSLFTLHQVAWMMCALEFIIFFATYKFLASTAFEKS